MGTSTTKRLSWEKIQTGPTGRFLRFFQFAGTCGSDAVTCALPARVQSLLGRFSLEYEEDGQVWGDFEFCPRDEIRISGSTVGGETLLIFAAEHGACDVLNALLVGGAQIELKVHAHAGSSVSGGQDKNEIKIFIEAG